MKPMDIVNQIKLFSIFLVFVYTKNHMKWIPIITKEAKSFNYITTFKEIYQYKLSPFLNLLHRHFTLTYLF